MLLLIGLLACDDGTAAIKAELEADGYAVLQVEVEPDHPGVFDYAATKGDQFCVGTVGKSGTSLGCASSTSSLRSDVCESTGGSLEAGWRCEHAPDGDQCYKAADAACGGTDPACFTALTKAADLGSLEAKADLGVVARDGLFGQSADADKARTLFETTCAAGNGRACMLRGALAESCAPERLEWSEKGAALGSANSANEAGVYLDNCPGADAKQARAHFDTACAGKVPTACANLGFMLKNGRGGDADPTGALVAFRAGCALDDARACNGAGNLAPEADRAALYRKACDLGSLDGCNNLGMLLVESEATTAEALPRFEAACDGGMAVACRNAGVMHRDGRGVPKHAEAARAMFVRGCDAGDIASCGEVRPTPY